MQGLDGIVIVVLAAAIFGAALVNGAVGFGFALLGIAALTFVVDAKTAVIVMSVVTPTLSTLQLRHHWSHRGAAASLWTLLAGAVIGSAIGTQLLILVPAWMLSVALGIFAFYYVISTYREERAALRPRAARVLAPVVGLTAGMMNGSLGASGPVLGSYLHALGLRKRDFAFAISLIFAVMGVLRIALLAALGAYSTGSFLVGLSLFVPAFVGQRVGFLLQGRMDARRFELALFALLVVAGANLILKGAEAAMAGTP